MQNGTHGLVSVTDPDLLTALEDLPVLQRAPMPLLVKIPI